MSESAATKQKVHLVSLGCPKNRVDSEVMLGHLDQGGYSFVDSPDDADVIVVNTCAFIDSAKEESVDAILEMGEFKKTGSATKLVVAGCLSQRYAPQLAEEIPEVDHFLGTGNFDQILDVLGSKQKTSHRALPILGQDAAPKPAKKSKKEEFVPFGYSMKTAEGEEFNIPDPDFSLRASSPRVSTLPSFTRYLKVSEGCSNRCSFCIIPKLRGLQRSRTIADVVKEMEQGIQEGVVEFNLIAQDLCAFGKDLTPKQNLASLLRALNRVAANAGRPVWIRCLYAYPKGLTRNVTRAIAESEFVVPYLDMPLQHISDPILKRMRRGKGGESTKALLRRLRGDIPGLVLRTTFITGLPGETEEDFQELMEFAAEMRFESMGVFAYSPEEDTPAATMSEQVPLEVAERRRSMLMTQQQRISAEQQQAMQGREIDVLVEGVSEETDLLLQGRHVGQAPEIDGLTYITDGVASPGDIVRVRIEQTAEYDLAGPIV